MHICVFCGFCCNLSCLHARVGGSHLGRLEIHYLMHSAQDGMELVSDASIDSAVGYDDAVTSLATHLHESDMWLRHVQAPAPRPVPAKDIPSHLRVCCGTMRGNFDVQRALVILDGGREISPTEFERMAGKAASKKWKASVRIDKVSMRWQPDTRDAVYTLMRTLRHSEQKVYMQT